MIAPMDDLPTPSSHRDSRVLALKLGLLGVWVLVTFVLCFFARALDFDVLGWPFGYWFAAQGAMLAFIAIVAVHAWAMNRLVPEDARPTGTREDDA
jgi:putative solute:sodium symporter small subunit